MNPYDYYITPEEYEIAERNGISERVVCERIRKLAWDKERAITEPIITKNKYGNLVNIARENGVSKETFYKRMKLGWESHRAVTTPVKTREEIIGMLAGKHRKYPKEIIELAESNGISYDTFRCRVRRLKWDIVKAATTPIMNRRECGLLSKEKLKKYIDCLHKLNEVDYMERCNKKNLSV
ncbi:hypothetical protein [Clostridium baratii]|uniref:hypothetical protein n=1 Tax=Clostridium baratii TaxID=1561 RepID=UPI0030CA928D